MKKKDVIHGRGKGFLMGRLKYSLEADCKVDILGGVQRLIDDIVLSGHSDFVPDFDPDKQIAILELSSGNKLLDVLLYPHQIDRIVLGRLCDNKSLTDDVFSRARRLVDNACCKIDKLRYEDEDGEESIITPVVVEKKQAGPVIKTPYYMVMIDQDVLGYDFYRDNKGKIRCTYTNQAGHPEYFKSLTGLAVLVECYSGYKNIMDRENKEKLIDVTRLNTLYKFDPSMFSDGVQDRIKEYVADNSQDLGDFLEWVASRFGIELSAPATK